MTNNPESPVAGFLVEKQPWMAESVCAGASDIWFRVEELPSNAIVDRANATKEAFEVCASCPVRVECGTQALLEEGTAPYGRYGIRAHMTPAQRQVIARRGGLKGRDPAQLIKGRDNGRRIPAIPANGVPWSRHHTTLLRKIVCWLAERGSMDGGIALICKTFDANEVPVTQVLDELWAIGVLNRPKVGLYTYRRDGVRCLTTTNDGEGDSHA